MIMVCDDHHGVLTIVAPLETAFCPRSMPASVWPILTFVIDDNHNDDHNNHNNNNNYQHCQSFLSLAPLPLLKCLPQCLWWQLLLWPWELFIRGLNSEFSDYFHLIHHWLYQLEYKKRNKILFCENVYCKWPDTSSAPLGSGAKVMMLTFSKPACYQNSFKWRTNSFHEKYKSNQWWWCCNLSIKGSQTSRWSLWP